jgi:hypothetical protein
MKRIAFALAAVGIAAAAGAGLATGGSPSTRIAYAHVVAGELDAGRSQNILTVSTHTIDDGTSTDTIACVSLSFTPKTLAVTGEFGAGSAAAALRGTAAFDFVNNTENYGLPPGERCPAATKVIVSPTSFFAQFAG